MYISTKYNSLSVLCKHAFVENTSAGARNETWPLRRVCEPGLCCVRGAGADTHSVWSDCVVSSWQTERM